MIRLTSKRLRGNFDYVFDKTQDFIEMKPYLLPKLKGKWVIGWVAPGQADVREYLKSEGERDCADITILLDESSKIRLESEFPQLWKQEISPWNEYMKLLADFPVNLPTRVVKEIFWRAGPRCSDLEQFLERLKLVKGEITLRTLDKMLPPKRKVYAMQVLRAFLLRDKNRWKLFEMLHAELGDKITFYALRKWCAALFREKEKHLNGEQTSLKEAEHVNALAITRAYCLFETAASYKQLVPLLHFIENCAASPPYEIERRKSKC